MELDTANSTDLVKVVKLKDGAALNGIATLKLTLTWTDKEANNASDTDVGTAANKTLTLPVTVTVEQYIGA